MKFIIFIILALAAMYIQPAIGEYSADYWLAEARQHSLQGSYEEAVASYDKALELDSTNATILIGKGLALANLGRFNEAIDNFDQAMLFDSSNADIWYFKGLALSSGLAKHDSSIDCFDKALEINPEYYEALLGRGMAQKNAGRLDDSLESFEAAIRIKPQDPNGWNSKGVVLLEQGKYQDALSCFNKALEFDPNYEAAQKNKDAILQYLNQDNFYELDEILYRAKQREGSLMN